GRGNPDPNQTQAGAWVCGRYASITLHLIASTSRFTPSTSGPRNETITPFAAGDTMVRSAVSISTGGATRLAARVTTPPVSQRFRHSMPISSRMSVVVTPTVPLLGADRLIAPPTLSHENGANRARTSVRVVESTARSANAETV